MVVFYKGERHRVLAVFLADSASPDFDSFPQFVNGTSSYRFLCSHNPGKFRPVISYSFTQQLYPYCIHNPIGEQPKEDVRLGGLVLLMVNGPQIQIQFQSTKTIM